MSGFRNTTGSLEVTSFQDYTFNEQFATFQRSGYAVDASTNQVIGDARKQKAESALSGKDEKARVEKKRKALEDLAAQLEEEEEESGGPWAKFVSDVDKSSVPKKKSGKEKSIEAETDEPQPEDAPGVHIMEPDREEEMWEKKTERKQQSTLPPRPARGTGVEEAKTIFHGSSLLDYQGRPWCTAPSNIRAEEADESHKCYIPKKCIKKLAGHTKGVQAVKYMPGTGHLLLSASMDGKCKVWDTLGSDMSAMRTYAGHSEGIRTIDMSNHGDHFLSSGFDRLCRYWDLETGQAVATFTNRQMLYDVKFCTRDNNVFLAAASDNKIYQFDIRGGQMEQVYNHHLQAVNTVTFFDDGRKFMSTSDDKKILVWEFGIPVPIKQIADPGMHCIPAVAVHPSRDYVACQSMDNKIVAYQTNERGVRYGKKVFQGHNNTGYACQMGFSPNGEFLVSGDGRGELHFWSWKNTTSMRKFHAHDGGPCMAADWHPLNPSRIATCGWDGLVKIWDS